MSSLPLQTPGSNPFPRRLDGKEIGKFWTCYMQKARACGVKPSKPNFTKYFLEPRYITFEAALSSYDQFIKNVCAKKPLMMPWGFIDNPESYIAYEIKRNRGTFKR